VSRYACFDIFFIQKRQASDRTWRRKEGTQELLGLEKLRCGFPSMNSEEGLGK
jgi:hypothetical protein